MMKNRESDMDQNRIEQLEKLGLEWSMRESVKKQHHEVISQMGTHT
jgi:hypothetical protein